MARLAEAYDEVLIYYAMFALKIDRWALARALMSETNITPANIRAHFQALVNAILAEPGREALAEPWLEAIQTLAD